MREIEGACKIFELENLERRCQLGRPSRRWEIIPFSFKSYFDVV